MEKRKTMFIAAGTGIAVAAILGIALAFQNFAETDAADKSVCWSDAQFDAAKRFDVAKPSWSPTGYSLQCQNSTPYQAIMTYSSKPLNSTDYDAAMRQDGAITIIVNDETLDGENPQIGTPQERLKETTRLLTPELKEKMQFRYITVNGNPGWAREAGDYGTLTTQYSNGTIISTEQTQEPARVEFYLQTTQYVLMGFRPADELIKVAESIPAGS